MNDEGHCLVGRDVRKIERKWKKSEFREEKSLRTWSTREEMSKAELGTPRCTKLPQDLRVKLRADLLRRYCMRQTNCSIVSIGSEAISVAVANSRTSINVFYNAVKVFRTHYRSCNMWGIIPGREASCFSLIRENSHLPSLKVWLKLSDEGMHTEYAGCAEGWVCWGLSMLSA